MIFKTFQYLKKIFRNRNGNTFLAIWKKKHSLFTLKVAVIICTVSPMDVTCNVYTRISKDF
jgi:hypothetical protein